jgi:hypothetical protein
MYLRLVPSGTDEQLQDALTITLQQGLEEQQGRDNYVDKDASHATIAPLGWPGHTLDTCSQVGACPLEFLARGSFSVKFLGEYIPASYYTVSIPIAVGLLRWYVLSY